MAGRLCRELASWKWVLGYTALLLLSLNQTRRFLDWLEDRNLAGLQALFLLFAGIGCFFLLLRHIYRTRGGFTLSTGLRLVGFVCLYLCCMFLATDLTVDRIHFVEYGILGLLCFHAVRPGHGQVRRAAHAMVAVFAIGLLDETVQGLLASRYYAVRDVLIDLMAGFLAVLGILWWPPSPREPQERVETIPSASTPRTGEPSRRVRAGDTGPLLLTVFLVLGMLWVGRVAWDPEPLHGAWERQNRCGRTERIQIGRDETILWEDVAGGRARGRYRIRGNRLDGPLLEVEVLEGKGSDSCAWTTGERRDRYFRVDTDRLVFMKEREFPFRRVGPD
jgi:hypothetical protein